MFSKFAKIYYSTEMKKHDMVPDHSFFEGVVACLFDTAPKDHYKNLEEGNIILSKSKTFSFCKEGVLVEGEPTVVKSDIVILGTGFKGDQKIKDMFTSEYFHGIVIGSTSMGRRLYRSLLHKT
jgi:dimethylaniline monooxygenase (N-oxide forming)